MVLDILREAGNSGISAQSVHREVEKKMRTSISQSKIYGLLKRLYQMQWVHRYYDRGDEALHSIIDIDWGMIVLDKTYENILNKKEREYMVERLFPEFIDFIKKTLKDLHGDPDSEKWLPQRDSYCKVCQNSHEAGEFVSSILDFATAEFMASEPYIEFMKKNHFTEREK